MIAADTSSLIAFFAGERAPDTEQIAQALQGGQIAIPPVVLTEVLSDATCFAQLAPVVSHWPQLDVTQDYWLRAAKIRAILLEKKLAAKIPDALIAQSCIDHDVALITRDADFRHFAKYCGLKLA